MPTWKAQVPIKALLLLNILHPGSSSSDTTRNKINQTLNKLPCQETNSTKPVFQENVKCCNCTSVLRAFQHLTMCISAWVNFYLQWPHYTNGGRQLGLPTHTIVAQEQKKKKKKMQALLIILSCSELFPGKGKKEITEFILKNSLLPLWQLILLL